MFKLLNIKVDLDKLKSIRVIFLGKDNFAYANFLNSCCEGFVYQNECDTKCKASNFAQSNHVDMVYIKNNYSNDFACSNFNNVLINIDIVPKQVGLHLICHETMHYLASDVVAKQLRDDNSHGTSSDEPINEFFARLATVIFNSMDECKNHKISGYTLWDDEIIFKDQYNHSKSLGLYGKLMAEEKYLVGEQGCKKYSNVDYIKRLAGYYFLNIPV